MSDYLSKFQATTRRKVNADLIQRWEWDARFNGDQNIKNQIAGAKRTATSLQKAHQQFSNLRPEVELAINAAAKAMRDLAEELQPLAAWAKAYKEFCEAERKRERTAALEAIADERWGKDAAKFLFERDLILELKTEAGRTAFGRWMHSRIIHREVAVDSFGAPFLSGLMSQPTSACSQPRRLKKPVTRRNDRSASVKHTSTARGSTTRPI